MTGERPVVPDHTVVIPTVGRELLRGCIDSIADGSHWPAELVVVDQGRSQAVADWLARLRARGLRAVHVPSRQTGIAAATNRGLERVQTAYVAVTHDDCRVRGDWLATLSAQLRQAGDAVVTGRVEPEGGGLVLTVVTSPTPRTYTKPLLDGDVLFPPNMGFPLRLLDRVGLFDEHPALRAAGEDSEWAHRALRAGVPIVYDQGVVVGHVGWMPDSRLLATYRRYARGQGAFYGRHLRRGDAFIARRATRDLVRGPWLVVRALATRNPRLLSMGRGEVAGILPGILAGLRNARPD